MTEKFTAPAQKLELLEVQFDPVTKDELHAYIGAAIAAQAHVTVFNLNVYAANLAQTNTRFRAILNRADLVFCDGFGIRLGARLLGARVPPRITYADWLWVFATFCARHGFSVFLLGARPGVAAAAARVLQQHAPGLVIAGVHHGYFDKTSDGPTNKAVIETINAAQPDILLACFGMPIQEYWLEENWGEIRAHVALTGGAALDYISGNLQRGPRWLTDYGFEWLARLLIEPKRLWQRYLVGNPVFLYRVLRQRLVSGPIKAGGTAAEQSPSSAGALRPPDGTSSERRTRSRNTTTKPPFQVARSAYRRLRNWLRRAL